jgi:exodeoxyribonuclease VII large subunit
MIVAGRRSPRARYNRSVDTAAQPPAANELTVSELTRYIRAQLEGDPALRGVWVQGEASNVRLAGSGHLYFTLKDESSQLAVAYFAYSAGRSRRKAPEDGELLLVHGDVRVYEPRGAYQLVADDLIPAGRGGLAARFEALKAKLYEEGLFAAGCKVPLPAVPRKVAIVTGLATAALRDVLNVLARRAPYLEAVVFPASVQGEKAAGELIAALKVADACPGIELILLVRGGGSIEDLWCFNDEALARAIAEIERPVITGVGHEIDFTIADFVADQRAPTPSAAAELAAPDSAELSAGVAGLEYELARACQSRLDTARVSLARLFDRRLIRDALGELEQAGQGVDSAAEELAQWAVGATQLGAERVLGDYTQRLALPLARKLERAGHVLPLLRDDVLRAGRQGAEDRAQLTAALAARLNGLDPRAPKKLGFALVWDADGRLVRRPEDAPTGTRLRVELAGGELSARSGE